MPRMPGDATAGRSPSPLPKARSRCGCAPRPVSRRCSQAKPRRVRREPARRVPGRRSLCRRPLSSWEFHPILCSGIPIMVRDHEGAMMERQSKLANRTLGSCGIEVSAIGLGCMSFSGIYGASDDRAAVALIHEALDSGVTLLDTSDMYGWGHNEALVGRAIAGRRAGIVLASK